MEKEITIVTAFFNINRQAWKKFERTEEQYFEYFRGWAQLKNMIIVYCETENMKNKILEFRDKLGLGQKTIVHIIDDFRSIDPKLLASIQKAADNKIQQGARLFAKNPEVWNADYDYVMLLKMWCVQDAVSRKETGDMVAWMDFGYNHGGAILDINSDFNFTWKYDFPDKINVFLVQELDDRPIFDIVCTMDTYIMGTVIVGAASLWNEFWNLMRTCMMELNDCGFTDDDQNVILMSYRKKPELFNTYKSDWQLPLKQFGGEHINALPPKSEKYAALRKLVRAYKKRKTDRALASRIYKYIRTKSVH
ncbi:HtrL family protein [Ruminococcus sp. AM27-16]|nr:HtrL family protein [Ruminococcus sp. AM27-16]